MKRSFASSLIFCTVLALACLGERRFFESLPGHVLEEPGVALKLRGVHEGADEIGLVFLGSSRVFRQLNPKVFEAQLSEQGRALVAYNLGLPGMRFYEQLYLLDRFVVHPPPALRWLLIELTEPDPELENANLLSRRSIEWHTPRLTWFALRTIWSSQRGPAQRLAMSWTHLQGMVLRVFNTGLGVPAVTSLLAPAPEMEDLSRAGYLPAEFDHSRAVQEHRQEYLAGLEANPRLLELRVEEILDPARAAHAGAVLEHEMRGLVARLRESGIEPLFFLSPPAERSNSDWRELRQREVLPNLFAFDDPREFPDFYLDRSIRFDLNHMDKVGGNTLTRLLAADVAAHMSTLGAP